MVAITGTGCRRGHTVEIDYTTEVAPFTAFDSSFFPAGMHVSS